MLHDEVIVREMEKVVMKGSDQRTEKRTTERTIVDGKEETKEGDERWIEGMKDWRRGKTGGGAGRQRYLLEYTS